MDGKIFNLIGELNDINAFFEKMMKASIKFYEEDMARSTIQISQAIPSRDEGTNRRLINRERCRALINMDQEQRSLAEACALDRSSVRRRIAKKVADRRKPVNTSAWFGGEYDERTYY